MSRSLLRAAASAGVVLAASLAAAPLAPAAEAPTRTVTVDESGRYSAGSGVAIGPGAREVILNVPVSGEANAFTRVVVRDVAANTTKQLAGTASKALGASTDLSKVLISTYAKLVPADTNGYPDLYVLDRATGKFTLVSRDASGAAAAVSNENALISADGATVAWQDWAGLTRTTVATGARQLVAADDAPEAIDATANVITGSRAYYVGARKVAIPTDYTGASKVSADGRTIVRVSSVPRPLKLAVIDTASGALRGVALPDWLANQAPVLLGVSADGKRAFFSERQPRAGVNRLVVGSVDLATGALAQLGGDLPYSTRVSPSGAPQAITGDAGFVVAGDVLGQLGTAPIPGTAPVLTPSAPSALASYFDFWAGCKGNGKAWPLTTLTRRPTLLLKNAAQGTAPQVPAKADVTVTMDNGVVANAFTLNAGAQRELTSGVAGGYTIAARITFKDGTTLGGSIPVKPFTPTVCPNFS